jgi:hypothetical protein
VDYYATLAADYWHEKGKQIGGFYLFFRTVGAFLRSFVFKQGFRDGMPGLIIAVFAAYSVFLKYAKVWERNNSEKEKIPDAPAADGEP